MHNVHENSVHNLHCLVDSFFFLAKCMKLFNCFYIVTWINFCSIVNNNNKWGVMRQTRKYILREVDNCLNRNRGFTLIEVIVVMVFAGIILTIAVPNFNTMIKNNRLATQANELVSSINLARSEAVSRGDRITVCRSLNGSSCNSSSGHWEDGWIVFHDPLNSGAVGVVENAGQLIRVYSGLQGDLTLRTGATFADFMSYLPQGQSQGSGGLGNDTFRLCDSRGAASAYSITVIATGRVSTSKTATSCP